MHFTKGPLRAYERLMQEKPGHDRKSVKAAEKRDCKHCRHFDEYKGKCGQKKCITFDD